MELADRLKELCQHAERAVVDRKHHIKHAIDTVGSAANKATKGKYEDKIAKAGEKASAAVDKLGSNGAAAESTDAGSTAEPTASNPEGAAESTATEAEDAAESTTSDADGAADTTMGASGDAAGQDPQPSEPPAGT